jgi:hypothetical protein
MWRLVLPYNWWWQTCLPLIIDALLIAALCWELGIIIMNLLSIAFMLLTTLITSEYAKLCMCIHHCDIPSISISAKKTRCWESGLKPGLSVKGGAFGFCSHQQIVLQWNPQSVSLYSENAKKLSFHQLWVRRESSAARIVDDFMLRLSDNRFHCIMYSVHSTRSGGWVFCLLYAHCSVYSHFQQLGCIVGNLNWFWR